MTGYPHNKTFKKKTVLSFTALLRLIRNKDLHHHDGMDFLSFDLKTDMARYLTQYFSITKVSFRREKTTIAMAGFYGQKTGMIDIIYGVHRKNPCFYRDRMLYFIAIGR